MKPIPNDYICPSEHGMNNARKILPCKGSARCPQINASCPITKGGRTLRATLSHLVARATIPYILMSTPDNVWGKSSLEPS